MGTLEALLATLGLNKASLITGALGAALAAYKADASPVAKVVNFIAGFCFAAYGAGLVVLYFNMSDTPTVLGGLGFALGYLGMAIMDAAMLAAGSLKSIDWKAVLEKALAKAGL